MVRRQMAALPSASSSAHRVGDANRSAHVERFFDHIEKNFLAGRSFADWDTLNAEARAWCDRDNARPRRHLHASPRELFATERLRLRPLPLHVPEVYRVHQRVVDTEGYVNVWRNRYSVPWQSIGRTVEVRGRCARSRSSRDHGSSPGIDAASTAATSG
jgi:hypothetical protein